MVRKSAATALAAVAVLATACEPPRRAEPREEDKALQRAVQAPQDRARAVEQDLLEAQKRTDRAMEEQEGGRH